MIRFYEYRCPECKMTVEVEDPDAELTCDDGTSMTRTYTFSGVRFNGPGFYRVDNKPYFEENGKRYWK